MEKTKAFTTQKLLQDKIPSQLHQDVHLRSSNKEQARKELSLGSIR